MTQMPDDLKPILEPGAGDLMTADQVDFLFDRLMALLIRPDGTVVRAASKWDQAALDAATRVILIGENQLGRPIRLITEKDIDSRSRFR